MPLNPFVFQKSLVYLPLIVSTLHTAIVPTLRVGTQPVTLRVTNAPLHTKNQTHRSTSIKPASPA